MEDWEMYVMDLPEEKLARAIKEDKEGRLKCSEERYNQIVGKLSPLYVNNCLTCNKVILGSINYCSDMCESIGGIERLRELIRKEGECSMCGAFFSTNGRSLHIHHVDENTNNNKPENLLLVCSKCHKRAHVKYWRPNFEKWEILLKKAKKKGHKFVTKN